MLLTINIVSHNRPYSCYEAFLTIINQSIQEENLYELIIVDDFSKKENINLLKNLLKKYKFKLIENTSNKKLAYSRNQAIFNSSSEWYAFCDDDDRWQTNMIKEFKSHVNNKNFCADMVLFLDKKFKKSWESILSPQPRLRELILAGVTPPVSSQFYKTEMLKKIKGYDINIKSGVDHDLWINLCKTLNPKVSVCWGNNAIVCDDLSLERMTTNEKLRSLEINNSLKIWEPKIKDIFGKHFFIHFKNSYHNHLAWKVCIRNFMLKKYIKFIFNLSNMYNLKKLIKRILFGKSLDCNSFPRYKFK